MCKTSPEFNRLEPFRIRCFPQTKEETVKGKYFCRDDNVAVAIQDARKRDTRRLHERVR